MRVLALLAAFLVAGCLKTVVSEAPPLVEYDQATLNQLADEIEAAPPGAVWPRFIVDYRVLRDQIRASQ